MTIGFSVITSKPRSSARTMYWLWNESLVVTMTTSGFVLSSISSKFVNVGQSTPISAFEFSTRFGLMSQRPTNWTMSEYRSRIWRPHMPVARSPVPMMA